MEESLVIVRLLFPTNENSPKTIHPGVKSLDDPAACATPVEAFGSLLVTTGLDVWRVAATVRFASDNVCVKSLIAAEMLPATGSRTRTAKRNAVERSVKEFLIVSVRAVNRQAQRHTAAVGQHRAFDARLAPIRRVWPGFFPRPREPWWSRRPDFATSIGCRGACYIVAGNISTIDGTSRGAPILGSSDATCCPKKIPSVRPSTDSRCEECKRCRRQLSANLLAGDRLGEMYGIWAKTIPCVPIDRREYANSDRFVRWTCRNPL